jgi:hypothetical protein
MEHVGGFKSLMADIRTPEAFESSLAFGETSLGVAREWVRDRSLMPAAQNGPRDLVGVR